MHSHSFKKKEKANVKSTLVNWTFKHQMGSIYMQVYVNIWGGVSGRKLKTMLKVD